MNEQAKFRSLRVLIVGGRPAGVQILRTVFSLVGIGHVVAVSDSRHAIELLRTDRFAAVFADDHVEPVMDVAFPLATRRTPGVLNPMIPLFLLCSAARRRHIELARDSGVTDVLARPLSAATIMRKMRAAIANPRPFIAAPDFFGPDRRAGRLAQFAGDERRRLAPKKVKVDAAAATRLAGEPVLV